MEFKYFYLHIYSILINIYQLTISITYNRSHFLILFTTITKYSRRKKFYSFNKKRKKYLSTIQQNSTKIVSKQNQNLKKKKVLPFTDKSKNKITRTIRYNLNLDKNDQFLIS